MNQAAQQSQTWTLSKAPLTAPATQARLCAIVACVGGALSLHGAALAQDELGQPAPATTKVADSGGASLEALLQRIDSLERKNKALDTQVADLKAIEGEKWLSEERAGQIRGVVEDVLADSESRASLRQDAMTAGWNDGFFLASPDGRFKLEVGGFIQPAFMWSSINPAVNDPTLDQLPNRYGFGSGGFNELIFKGHVFSPAIEFMVKTNFVFNQAVGIASNDPTNNVQSSQSGQLQLLDAWVRINFSDTWSMRFGQYRLPYAREQLVVDQYQMGVSRSIVSRNYGLWYSQGIELQFQGDDMRWRLSVDNGATDNVLGDFKVVGSEPLNSPWYSQQTNYSVNSRTEWKPFGAWEDFNSFTSPMGEQAGLLIGLAFHRQVTQPLDFYNTTETTADLENSWNSVTVDGQWNFGGASFFASAYYNYIESNASYLATALSPPRAADLGSINAYGVTLQPAMYIDPKFEIFSRYEYANWTSSNATPLSGGPQFQSGPLSIVTVGLNWYIDGQDLKWTTDVGTTVGSAVGGSYVDTAAGWRGSGEGEMVFRSRLQLIF